MIKDAVYVVQTGEFSKVDFASPDARVALAAAMVYAKRQTKRGLSVTIFRNGNIIWTSQNMLTVIGK